MKSAKSGKIVGNSRVLSRASRGGSVHGAEEIYSYSTIDGQSSGGIVTRSKMATDGWIKANTDPFYTTNMIHLDSIGPHHLMKDYSGNSNDDFIHEQAQNRTMVATRFGPAYQNCWSTLFGGAQTAAGGYYSVDHYTNLLLSSGAFTIEFWMKKTATPSNPMYIISKGSTANVSSGLGWTVYNTRDNGLAFYDAQGNANTTTSGITLSTDTWYHVAVVRNSTGTNDTRIYIDGQVYANGTSTGNFTDTNTMFIATDRVATTGYTQFKGNLTDIRISNSAKYTSVFAKPNTPLDMTGSVFQMPISARHHLNIRSEHPSDAVVRSYNWIHKVIDSPFGNPEHLTGAGAHSIGSYDSARFFQYHDPNPQNTPMRIGTSPFTIESWIYRTQNQGAADSGIISKGAGSRGAAGNGWSLMVLANGILEWHSGSTVISGSANTAVQNGGWYHVMAIREQLGANMLKLYVNGQLAAVGTDNTNFTDAMMTRIGSARDYQYNLNGYLSTIRVSHTGFPTRYGTGNTSLANVVTNTASFVANTGTIDSSVKLLTAYSNTARPYTPQPTSFYTGQLRHAMLQYGANDIRVNGKIYNNRGRGYSYNWWDSSTARVVANSSLGDFSFASTQDFSIEFWAKFHYADYDGHETIKYLMDMQHMFKDSGLRIRWKSRNRNLDVSCNGRMMLVASSATPVTGQWTHILVQRANNAMAFYVNGEKEDECIHTPAIAASNNRITFGVGSYEKGHYGNWLYGQMSDVRVVKGTAAYAVNGTNPDFITLPKSPLTAIANTVLLTMNSPIPMDMSGRNNTVTIGGEANTAGQSDGYLTSSWSAWPVPATPYSPQDDYDYEASHGMNMVSDDVIHYVRGLRNQESATAGPYELSWLGRLVKPWTIEFVYWAKQVDPSSPGSIGQYYPESNRPLFRTGNANTHQGLEFNYHYNGTNFVYGDQSLKWWNPQDGITANNTSMSSNSFNGINNTFKGHAFNHLAAVYDPSKINTFAMFLNGKRIHANVGTFNSLTGRYDTPVKPQKDDFITEYPKMSNLNALRISENARYDTAATTITIPTKFVEDANTHLMFDDASTQNDKTLNSQFMVRNVWPNFTFKKYGDYSWRFDNKRSDGYASRIEFHNHAYYTNRTMDPRYDDWTIECWASWLNTDSGGVAFNNAQGNCLFHISNVYWIGLSNGIWRFKWANAAGDDSINFRDQVRHHQVNTSISVAQCSWSNRSNFDHICLVRKAGSTSFYVNGVEQSNKFSDGHMESWGADEGPTDNLYPDVISQYTAVKLGSNWNEDLNYAWNGFVQDFRWSRMARYKTKVIQGVPTMVFADTDVAALPYLSNPYPTK